MDTATVQRFIEGMKYEAERTGPPEGFPTLPDIAGRPLHRSRDFSSSNRTMMWRELALRLSRRRIAGARQLLLWKKTGSPILIVRGKDDVDPRLLQHLPPSGRPTGQDCLRLTRRPRVRLSRLDLRPRRHADQPARQARLRRASTCRARALIGVRCERFYNWVFINEDPEAEPLLKHIAPFSEHFEQFQPG